MECGVQPVSSTAACDIAAASASGTPVHFGAHPMLTRVVPCGPVVDGGGHNEENSNILSLDGALLRNKTSRLTSCKDGLSHDIGRCTIHHVERYSINSCMYPDKRSDAVSDEKEQFPALDMGEARSVLPRT